MECRRWALSFLLGSAQPGACSAAQGFSCRAASSRRCVEVSGGQQNPAQQGEERAGSRPTRSTAAGRLSGAIRSWFNTIGDECSRAEAIEAFRKAFWDYELPVTPARARTELSAYDYLSCWCRQDQACHVDEYIRGAIFCEHKFRDVDASGRCCLVCRANVCTEDSAVEGPLRYL